MAGALSIIRPITENDLTALDNSAHKFATRHNITLGADFRAYEELDMALWARVGFSNTATLKRLWQACLCRALRIPVAATVTVAYGRIGHTVD
jgi:hypothetical protein